MTSIDPTTLTSEELAPMLRAWVSGSFACSRWRFFDGGWIDRWPAGEAAARAWPRAVELELTLAEGAAPQGALRRVIALPTRPQEGP